MSAIAAETRRPGPSPPRQHGSSSPSSRRVTRRRDENETDNDADSCQSSPRPPKLPRTTSNERDQAGATEVPTTVSTLPTLAEPIAQKDTVMTDALLEELECGMCAAVYIEPVALNGCGHVFCASCVVQWIKSLPRHPAAVLPGDPVPEPASCPHCRFTPIQTATPSRLAKTMVTFLLSRRPELARTPNEYRQAEELYTSTTGVIKFPTPPPPPRAPNLNEFWRPCRHCYSDEGEWKCPTPVPRFDVPEERALCLRADGLCPEGHRLCAGCDRLSPSNGPVSVNCGICGEGFCGDSRMGCDCAPVSQSKPTSQFNTLPYLLEDCPTDMLALAFKDNWTEMYQLSLFLSAHQDTMKAQSIYNDILTWLRGPESVDSGGLLGMMNRAEINLRLRTGAADEMQHAIMPVEEGETEARICGGCADEVFCSGLFEWWMRELKKPGVQEKRPANIKDRPNCKYGRKCHRQDVEVHAKKFNHICLPLSTEEANELQQDDTAPPPVPRATANTEDDAAEVKAPDGGGDNGDASSEASDDSDDSDNDDESMQFADVATQYDQAPEGRRLVGIAKDGLQPCWNIAYVRVPTDVAATSASTSAPLPPPAPAFAISNLIHTTSPRTSMAGSPPPLRASSPFAIGPRVSGSVSSPLSATGYRSWPSVSRAMTPPLGTSHAANTTAPTSSPSHSMSKGDMAATSASTSSRLAHLVEPPTTVASSCVTPSHTGMDVDR